MAKKTNKQLPGKIYDDIISRKFEKHAKELGITIENSFYVHGEYDWAITFTAKDILQAKKVTDSFVETYPDYIQKTTIMQTLMFMRKQYVLNPDRKKLKDFL
jgi:hypothetical protein